MCVLWDANPAGGVNGRGEAEAASPFAVVRPKGFGRLLLLCAARSLRPDRFCVMGDGWMGGRGRTRRIPTRQWAERKTPGDPFGMGSQGLNSIDFPKIFLRIFPSFETCLNFWFHY